MKIKNLLSFVAALSTGSLLCVGAAAQQDFAIVKVKSQRVAGNVYMLEGSGGNIGVFVGVDGVFIVDDQFAPLTEKIVAEIRKLSDGKIRFLINTHMHSDHVGGNENLGEMGALIVAHDTVRSRMAEGIYSFISKKRGDPAPAIALPTVTYSQDVSFHLNGEQVHVFHVSPAHTDGDSFVHFKGSNVLHLGDVFGTSGYPVIDVPNGGRFAGVIDAIERAIKLAGPNTRIIPGHGEISDIDDLLEVRDMLVIVRDRIQKLVDDGKDLEAVLAAAPTAEYDARWGQGFMPASFFIETVYRELKGG